MGNSNTKLRSQWHDGMAKWIGGQPWTYFVTFTTPYEMSTKSARRLMDRTHHSWCLLTDGACKLIYFMERNELRDGCHLHALAHVPDQFRELHLYTAMVDAYQAMAGAKVKRNDNGKITWEGRARIDMRRYNGRKDAGGYAAKYASKNNGPDNWDILLPNK